MISNAIKSQYYPLGGHLILFIFFITKSKNDVDIGFLYNFNVNEGDNFCEKKFIKPYSGKTLISIEENIRFIHFHHILACLLLYYFKSAR